MKKFITQISKQTYRIFQKTVPLWLLAPLFLSSATAEQASWSVSTTLAYNAPTHTETSVMTMLSRPFRTGGRHIHREPESAMEPAQILGLTGGSVSRNKDILDIYKLPAIHISSLLTPAPLDYTIPLNANTETHPRKRILYFNHQLSETITLSPYFHHEESAKSPDIGLGMQLILEL